MDHAITLSHLGAPSRAARGGPRRYSSCIHLFVLTPPCAPSLPHSGWYLRPRSPVPITDGWCRPPLKIERTKGVRLRDDIQRVTQMIADEFELMIRETPEQWHLLNPNWPSDYEVLGREVPEHLRDL